MRRPRRRSPRRTSWRTWRPARTRGCPRWRRTRWRRRRSPRRRRVARPACHGVGLGQDYLKPGMRGHAAGMSLLGHAEGCCIPSCGWLSRPCPRRSSPCSSGAQTAPARWCLGDQRRWAGGRLDVKFNARAAGSLGCGAFAVSQRSVREHSGVLTALSARTPCARCVGGGGGGGGGGSARTDAEPAAGALQGGAARARTCARARMR